MTNLVIVVTILLALAGLAYVVYFFVRVARGERLEEPESAPEYLTEAERETKACPDCGEKILDVAVNCKHCGSELDPEDDGKSTNNLGQLVGSVAGLALFIYLASLFFPDILAALKVSIKSPDIQISSTDLLKHYQENEVEADLKYKGKVALVTGTVGDVGKDISNNIYIALNSGSLFFSVQCFFMDAHAEEVSRIKKGAAVRLKGVIRGKFGNVLLRGCRVAY